ncbi:RRM domain-containing protein [Psidium guajava]|nr:RRM domain-containing protein [Psidium guajava]
MGKMPKIDSILGVLSSSFLFHVYFFDYNAVGRSKATCQTVSVNLELSKEE